MYKQIESVLDVRREPEGKNGIYSDIDSVVLLLMDVVSGDLFEKAVEYPDIDWEPYRNYKEQLETRGIHTVQYLLENPNVLYDEVAPHFDGEGETLERNVFDAYYSELLMDAKRVKDAVISMRFKRMFCVNDLLKMDPISGKGSAMISYQNKDGSRSRDEAMRWMFFHNQWFGPLTLPEEEES
ncbi:MAG: hypothetical protein KAH93_02410 [Candidatus Aenigmarchaeota archaeon]|nr:hypothetical protein [Candidatus Aenigmarchaeota archaeon]